MDGIQPYSGPPRPLVASVHPASISIPAQAHGPGPSPSSVKTASDYVRAVRRRVWLVLAVAIPLATAGTLYVLKMAPVYQVEAKIQIDPPKVDPLVRSLVSNGDSTHGDAVDEKYIPNTLAWLNSKSLAQEVVSDPGLGLPASAFDGGDPASELKDKVKFRQVPQSNIYIVTLEGRDPDRITRTLNFLVEKFKKRADSESRGASDDAGARAEATLRTYEEEFRNLELALIKHIENSPTLAPGGRDLKELEYDSLRQRLFGQKQEALAMRKESTIKTLMPAPAGPGDQRLAGQIGQLEERRTGLARRLRAAQRAAKNPGDAAILRTQADIDDIDADLARLRRDAVSADGPSPAEVYDQVLRGAAEEIKATENQLVTTLADLKGAMPNHHTYTTLMSEREQKFHQVAVLKQRIGEFRMLSETRKSPVKVHDQASQPTVPVKPNRAVYIAALVIFSLGLGLGLVCFLEHIDHSVKVPEHLTLGLGLPLFGVVPRMLRNARNHRGGHLWTPGTPDSIEADAYRNLRASLLGATGESPIVTLLVTSAKAGEGKSTTALNLAATCARAGERTLLMDVDLRRPSLLDVFPCEGDNLGLADVLRGEIPWERAVVQTDLPNLDFLPTGDTRDVPIEILGSLELRQLLRSLSEAHYDRVILDGPAVLGLADCRMLGRIVDAAVMVVRSGSQELRPLQRAKAMLELSKVQIAGVIFNGLSEDLENWSSYGPSPALDPLLARGPRGLGGPAPAAALMAGG